MYLLDTNILIYISKQGSEKLRARFESLAPGDAAMSIITYLELYFGAVKSHRAEKSLFALDTVRSVVPVLPLTEECASHYGRIRNELQSRGKPIGNLDMLIAAHALALGATLVTNNLREFSRVRGLKTANWI